MSAQAATSVSLALNASLSKITVDDALISGIIRQMVSVLYMIIFPNEAFHVGI